MLINANALHIPLADGCVHTIVTSPPYYGLRDYGTATWQGGDPECDHIQGLDNPRSSRPAGRFHGGDDKFITKPYKDVCGKCGAIRIDEQIGLEQTPDEYIANLVEVFRECKRILRDDGTLWVNIGDSYVSNTGDRNKVGGFQANPSDSRLQAESAMSFNKKSGDLKSKDLIGIPWMLAFALRADGWYLRQDIIWHKPNPMPESVKDRCTKSHEYIFLLSKSARYYFDNEAIKEPAKNDSGWAKQIAKNGIPHQHHKPGSVYLDPREECQYGLLTAKLTDTRNKRSVWTVTTKPYKGAHYATFPPDLIKPMILAGCPKGGIVLDPFVGSGTTVATAIKLGRKGIGIDLNIKYLTENARQRIAEAQMQPRLI